jgi:hypothetical protein
MRILSGRIWENITQYEEKCGSTVPASCNVSISLTDIPTGKIYIYYQIDGFYQSHRKYFGSKSNLQLAGTEVRESEAPECQGFLTNSQMGKTTSITGTPLDADKVAVPCGSMAKSVFNGRREFDLDNFKLWTTETIPKSVPISSQGIAWAQDKGVKFKNNKLGDQWLNMEDERFIVWMRAAMTPSFRKLWGWVENVTPGVYNLEINNNWPTSKWGGKKYFVLSQANVLGGKNNLLSYIYIGFGVLQLLTAIIFGGRKAARYDGILDEKVR